MIRSRKSAYTIIFLTVFADLIGFGIVIPLVGLYGRHFGASTFELSALGSIFSLMQMLFSPVWGRLSDKFGRRPILLISLLGSSLAYMAFGLAESFLMLFLGRMFAGIATANISTAQAYLADISSPSERSKAMGLIGAAFGLGFVFGPAIGGIATKYWGLAAPGLIAGSICGLNFIHAFFRLEESFPKERRAEVDKNAKSSKGFFAIANFDLYWRLKKNNPSVLLYIGFFFFLTFAFSNIEQTFALLFQNKFSLATDVAAEKTGYLLAFIGIVGALVQGVFLRKLLVKFPEKKLFIFGLFLSAALFAIFSFLPSVKEMYIAGVFMALGSGLVNPIINGLISKSAPEDIQGSVLGLSSGFGALARVLGPFCGLYLFSYNENATFLLSATVYGLVGLVFLVVLLKKPHQSDLIAK